MDEATGFGVSGWKEYSLVLAFFLVAAVLFTWPLVLHVHDGIVGGHGDPLLNTWIISWDARTIFTHPTRLFQGNIIYPSRDVLAYSEHQFTLGLIAAPVYFVSRNPILAYNFLVFFCIVVSGLGCYLLIKELTGSRWGGLAGGLFYALFPYKIGQLSHIQIFFIPFLPLMLLYLHRYLERGGWRNAALFAAFFLAQSLSSWHHLIYCAIAAGLMWLWRAVSSRRREQWLRLLGAAAVAAAVALLVVPFALPYMRAHDRLPGFERSLKEVELYGARGEDYLRVLDDSVVYGDAPSPFREGGIGYENVLYPGVMVLLLAVAGLALRRREGEDQLAYDPASFRRNALLFLALGALSVLLAFGPKIGGRENPFYMIPYRMGLLKFTRVPTRFFLLAGLCLAVLSGYGVAKLCVRSVSVSERGLKAGRLLGFGLVALLLMELLTWNLYVYPIPVWGDVPEVYSWLAKQDDARIIELPTHALGPAVMYDRDLKLAPFDIFEYLYREGDVMYFSAYHWKQVVNGYSGYSPFSYRRIITEMQGFPSARTVGLLRGLGVTHVLWDWNWVPSERMEEFNVRLFSTPGLSFEGDFGSKSVFLVEPGETSYPQEMEVAAVAPAAVPPRSGFEMGLLVKNPTQAPMVCVEEEWQRFTLIFRNGEGGTAAEARGEYRAPFFVDAGETVSVPLRVEEIRLEEPGSEAVPEEGSNALRGLYEAELTLEGGVLGDRRFALELEIVDGLPDSASSDVLAGVLWMPGGEAALNVPSPNGLYPLAVVRARNEGGATWKALPQMEDYSLPPGEVHLALSWTEPDGTPWEEQACSLPCDVAPGQEVEVPLLARPPATPGEYHLRVGLYREGSGRFGGELLLKVVVGGLVEGGP
ncbi:MAG: hypothetical protein HPY75_00295 [Actinobacteria bacterium]|nr:hypothetical protein [Actinomycetota bacterium]